MNNKSEHNNSKKYVFILLLIFIIVSAIIAVIAINYKDTDSLQNNNQAESVPDNKNDNTFAGDSNILFVCNGTEPGDTVFALLIEFRIYSETINLTFLDMDSDYKGQSYSDSYKYGGVDSLISSIENVRNCSVNRYMIIDKSGFGKITDKLGSINLYVTESFTYEASDKSYEINAGSNDLESDALYTYLTILSDKSDNKKLNESICDIIKTYISKINQENSEMIFGEICNSVITNITISDYFTSRNDFEYLLSHNPECVISDDIDNLIMR